MELNTSVEKVVSEGISEYAIETFDRAFPSKWDGVKPVARRIIYCMYEDNITTMHKVATVVGSVMKYHPHGDLSIGSALVNLGQKFRMNYPLVDGQGNFGNLAGDPPSAARYIECKLSKFAMDVITSEIDDKVVDFQLNYDRKRKEPVYLPTKLPLLLIEGLQGMGEAFSMTVSPHNLNDVVNMCISCIRDPKISNERLVNGLFPDYPNGGVIVNPEEIEEFYKKGEKGQITLRAKVKLDQPRGVIRIEEIPYGTNFEKISDSIRKRIEEGDPVLSGIIGVYPENSKNKDSGFFTFEIFCKKELNLLDVLNHLYRKTPLQSRYMHMCYLNYGGKVKEVDIKEIIVEWLRVRKSTLRRRFTYDISRAENQKHILEGILTLYDRMDKLIVVIRNTKGTKDDVVQNIMKTFPELTQIQANGIVERKLHNLTQTSKEDLSIQIHKLQMDIDNNKNLISDIDEVIIQQLNELKEKYGRERRTTIQGGVDDQQKDRSFTYGVLAQTQNALGMFDIGTLLTHGRKILSGLTPVSLVTGKEKQRIQNANVIYSDVIGCVVFYSDGTAVRKTLDDFPVFNAWVNQDFNAAELSMTKIAPITSNTKWLFIVSGEKKARRVDIEEFGTRRVNVGDCELVLPINDENDEVLCVNDTGEYFFDQAINFPTFSRNSAGVKTRFEENDKLQGIVVDRIRNSAMSVFLSDGQDHHLHTIKHTKLKRVKRTNAYKKLVGSVGKIKVIGLLDFPHMSREAMLVVGESGVSKMALRHFKPRKNPLMLNIKPVEVVQILTGVDDNKEKE